ncbi:hypothetical protein A3Q56_00562 [Intoshia linei]|uniref:Annexin n=1 Tax=Intoshia linei TaxID=1819745 RepID=A0A177BBV0_9BILA|nr:hypothetical protein A3Q56_00562 [Intoshia linei]
MKIWLNISKESSEQSFDATADSAKIYEACQGLGTNEAKIISILCNRPKDHIIKIVKTYESVYGKSLKDVLKSEISGCFLELMQQIIMATKNHHAYVIHNAIKDKELPAVIEVLVQSEEKSILELKKFYKIVYGKDLESEVLSICNSKDLKRLLKSLLIGFRDNTVDASRAIEDAKAIFEAGEDRMGTDELAIHAILATRSYNHIRLIDNEYKILKSHGLHYAIKNEMSGDLRVGYNLIVAYAVSKGEFFSRRIKKSIRFLGTNEKMLIRNLVYMREQDIELTKIEYKNLYGTSLWKDVSGDVSGDFSASIKALLK